MQSIGTDSGNERTRIADRHELNVEAKTANDARRHWIGRATTATVPLLAVPVAVLAPTPKLEWLLWLTTGCMLYLPIATLWSGRRTEKGFFWNAFERIFGSIGAMIVGGTLGVVAHLIFHRMIHFEPLLLWAFIASVAGLSASLMFPWLRDACAIVVTAFSPS